MTVDEKLEEAPEEEELEEVPEEDDNPFAGIDTAEYLKHVDPVILYRLTAALSGVNPHAQQLVTDFMRLDSPIERTNLPTLTDCQRIDYLLYAGKTLFRGYDNDPFTEAAHTESTSYMARNGEKAKQLVELLRHTPNIPEIQAAAQGQASILQRMLGRGGDTSE